MITDVEIRSGGNFMKRIHKTIMMIFVIVLTGCRVSPATSTSLIPVDSLALMEVGKEEYDSYINHYYYDLYDAADKEIYNTIYNALIHQEVNVVLPISLPENRVEDIFIQVLDDHPEIFYVTEALDYETAGSIHFNYYMTEDEIVSSQKTIQILSEDYLSQLDGMNIVQIADYTYDYIFQHINYNRDLFKAAGYEIEGHWENYNIVNGFVNGLVMCTGYAKCFQYLMNLAGYQCLLVTGNTYGTPHSWDVLELNDQFYYFDPTWDHSPSIGPVTYYQYYGLSYNQISKYREYQTGEFKNATSEAFNYGNTHGYRINSENELNHVVRLQKSNDATIIQCDPITYKTLKAKYRNSNTFPYTDQMVLFIDENHTIQYSNIKIIK